MSKKIPPNDPKSSKPRYRTFFGAWRRHRGLTLERLAEMMTTNKVRISVKERDLESWDQDYLEALSRALEVDEWSLLYRDPDGLNDTDEGRGWQIFDTLAPEDKAKALDYLEILKRASRDTGNHQQ